MCQHCDGYDHAENTAALGAALIRRQQDKLRAAAAPVPSAAPRPADDTPPAANRSGQ